MILIAQIAIGVFLGYMARGVLLGVIEYRRKRKFFGGSIEGDTIWNNIRMVI